MSKNTKVLALFKEDNNGNIKLLEIDAVQCRSLAVGPSTISENGLNFLSGTFGGITLSNNTITSNSLTLSVASGSINFSGASLVNVGSITTDPGFYSKAFGMVQVPSNSSNLLGSIILPANSVTILKPEFIASTSSGVSACGINPQKIDYVGGTMTFLPYQTNSITVDDPMLNNITLTFTQSGSTLNITGNNPTPLTLGFKLTVSVTTMILA